MHMQSPAAFPSSVKTESRWSISPASTSVMTARVVAAHPTEPRLGWRNRWDHSRVTVHGSRRDDSRLRRTPPRRRLATRVSSSGRCASPRPGQRMPAELVLAPHSQPGHPFVRAEPRLNVHSRAAGTDAMGKPPGLGSVGCADDGSRSGLLTTRCARARSSSRPRRSWTSRFGLIRLYWTMSGWSCSTRVT
jgi:hypothetical protein